ncbi:hypothetical protein Tco_0116810, partial [Tanacetum coccineum]
MAITNSCNKHNMIACVEKTERNADFHEVIDFLTGCYVNYALLVSPDVIQKLWIHNLEYLRSASISNDERVIEVFFGSCFFFCPLDYPEVVCESDEEVTSKYRSHEKARKDSSTMSLEELIAWEQEETQSPSYIRSPHVWKKTSASTSKGKVVLDDFEDVAMEK